MIPTGEQPLFHIYLPEALSLAQSNGLGEGWFLTFISYMAQHGAIHTLCFSGRDGDTGAG